MEEAMERKHRLIRGLRTPSCWEQPLGGLVMWLWRHLVIPLRISLQLQGLRSGKHSSKEGSSDESMKLERFINGAKYTVQRMGREASLF